MQHRATAVIGWGLLLMAAGASASPEAQSSIGAEIQCDGHSENLATYLEMSQVLFNDRDVERVGEFYAEDFISHNVDEGGIGTRKVKLVDMQNMWRHFERIEPDREVINNVIICNGDLVVAQVTTQGTHVGEGLLGNPEGGRRYRTSAMDIYRFKDGKVVERWGNNDLVAKARQLGMKLDLSLQPLMPEEAPGKSQ